MDRNAHALDPFFGVDRFAIREATQGVRRMRREDERKKRKDRARKEICSSKPEERAPLSDVLCLGVMG